jgi:hypothetical protein
MAFDSTLKDFVIFELPCSETAMRLCACLGAERLAWHEPGPMACCVRVLLSPERRDLAQLLRSAQEWLDDTELGAVAFELDGRAYFLPRRRVLQRVS